MLRIRFAPSPTGYLHIGSLRTALYAYLLARQNNGKFILRIDDTDRERYVEGAVEKIYKNLKWAGLQWDEGADIGGDYGPYIQSERLEIYKKYADELVEKGNAYYCFCTKEELEKIRKEQESMKLAPKYNGHCRNLSKEEIEEKLKNKEPFVIRQRVLEGETVFFDDLVYGKITVNTDELDDQILIKSDGFPTYNFANVVDDHLMGITHIIRGSEFLSSTPKFNLLYSAFGWQVPVYVHLPVITDEQHRKLSKREGDVAVDDFIAKGYTKDTIINYIALLGWNPGDDREMLGIEELIKDFSVEKIHKNPAIFDYKKLNWMNGQYLRQMPLEKFHEIVLPFYEKSTSLKEGQLLKISRILHERTEVPADIPEMIDFLSELSDYDISLHIHKKMKTNREIALKALEETLKLFAGLDEWNEENIKEILYKECDVLGFKTGQVMWPCRVALSGKQFTPGGAIEIADILGKEESLRRLKIGIEKLRSMQAV